MKEAARNTQPVVVKNTETELRGMHSFEASRFVIGYVHSGTKYIYTGDIRQQANAGDLFFLSRGTHFVEEIPGSKTPFEQIMFFYSPEQLSRVISQLSINHSIDAHIHHTCKACRGKNHIIEEGWDEIKHFFQSVNIYVLGGVFANNGIAEKLKLTELIYLIVSHEDSCMRSRVLSSADPEKELFEQTVYEYIFSDISLEQLAAKNNKSLTSFKKAFKNHFHETPHQWVVHQRLIHSRLLLITTNQPVSMVGAECRFPNTSHFIKLFRNEFGMTPAAYRRKYVGNIPDSNEENHVIETETGALNNVLKK